MDFLLEVLADAFRALAGFDSELVRVVLLTLTVSGIATVIGVLIGVPLGVGLGLGRFRLRRLLRLGVDVGMGMPPVLAGLFLLLLFWRSGPLGSLGLTFTPSAMVIAQVLLAVPIAAGVTAAAVEGLPAPALEQLSALRVSGWQAGVLVVSEARSGVLASVAASFGRVVSEVGAVMVVGGNILGETRVLTTLIVQESRQARFGTAIAAGIVLLVISLAVNLVLGGRNPEWRR